MFEDTWSFCSRLKNSLRWSATSRYPGLRSSKNCGATSRENDLQDARNPRRIKADENLGRVFGGQDQVTLLELTRGVNRHLFPCSGGSPVTDEELRVKFEEQVLAGSYETLGCSQEMSDEELKREFRELCQEYHPDRLAGEIPAGILKLAMERFQEILKRLRGCGDIPVLIPVRPYPSFGSLRQGP